MSEEALTPSVPSPEPQQRAAVRGRIIGGRTVALAVIAVLVAGLIIAEVAARVFGPADPRANAWVRSPVERGYDITRTSDSFRVLVLGDELHGGAFEELEKRYQSRWRVPYEIIELDPSANSPAEIFDAYFESARQYKPNVLIMTISPADIEALDFSLSRGWEASYYVLKSDGSLEPNQAQAQVMPGLGRFSALARMISPPKQSAFVLPGATMPAAGRVEAGFTDPRYSHAMEVFGALVTAISSQAEAEGSEFGVVVVPDPYLMYPDWYSKDFPGAPQSDQFDPAKIERQMVAILDAYGIAHFDLTPYMLAAQTGEALFRRHEIRLSHAGHDVVTEALDNWFSVSGWAAAETR